MINHFISSVPRPFFAASAAITVGLLGLSLSACDTAPGATDLEESAPIVSSLALSPGTINLDDIPPEEITNEVAHVTVTVQVNIDDEDGDARSLYIFVLPPDATSATAGEQIVEITGNGQMSADVELAIPTAETGAYTVKVYASDALGQLGNQTTGSLDVTASSDPPVIESVDLPSVIVRPGAGEPAVEVPIVVTVSDPDGLGNVLRVEMLVNGSGPLFLCDDGSVGVCNAGFPPSGDVTAGDGQFTITIQLDANNAPGQNVFVFKAVDRSGLESATEERIVEVQ
jgi:hypothetical protein